ncbi:hypothetical protein YC2023_066502 [Brassica napus]
MMVKVSWMIKLRPRLMYSSCFQMLFNVASSATSSSGSEQKNYIGPKQSKNLVADFVSRKNDSNPKHKLELGVPSSADQRRHLPSSPTVFSYNVFFAFT